MTYGNTRLDWPYARGLHFGVNGRSLCARRNNNDL
jgi:hypothetical protein